MAFNLTGGSIGQGMAKAQLAATGNWQDDDVERWLTDNPLPADFTWNGERAYPRKALLCGYGQWLRTAGSYHPALRGLFRLCCDVLINLPVDRPMPSPTELAALLKQQAERSAPDNPQETRREPIGNPTETEQQPGL